MINSIRTWWSRLPNAAQITLVAALVVLFPFVIDVAESAIRAAGGNLALLTQVNRALIYVVLALGLNIVVGFAGMLDLGYAAFFAIGAYAFGILTYPSHGIQMSFFLALWVCAAIASFFGIVVGSPTLRLRGDYLAIVTLAFGEIIPTVVRNLDDLTNGSQGLTPIGKPSFGVFEGLFGLEPGALNVGVDPHFWFYVIALLVAEDENQSVLTATENGFGKRTPIGEYTRHGRGTLGMIAIQTTARNGKVVAATLASAEDEIMLITDGGVLIRTRVREIREMGRSTQGVTLINLGEGEKLQGLQTVLDRDDEEANGNGNGGGDEPAAPAAPEA